MKQFTFSAQVANNLLTVLQGYSKTIRLLLVMFLTLTVSANAWGATYKLTKVTSVSAGEKYVFEQGGYVMNNSVSSSALQCTNSYNTTGLEGTEAYVWTLESATGGFYMKNVSKSSSQYLNNSSSTSVSFGSKSSIWKFTFTDSIAVIQNTSNSNRFLGWTSSTSHAYKAYATSNMSSSTYPHDITVYKLEEETSGGGSTTVDPTVTFSNGSYTIGGAALDLSTLWDSNSTGAVTYSVTNAGTTGATVNGTSFTATAAGTCTVQASQAATATYNAATATATITVTAPAGGGGGEGECSWTLVTDASTLKADDEVIITASGENNYALSTNQKSSNRGATAITKNGNTLTSPSADVQILALKTGSPSDTWAFYTGTSGYLYAASSSGNQLKTKTTLDEHGSWTISITDGVASIVAEGSSNRNVMQYNYNNGSPLFACYASASQTSLAIYKKICDGGGTSTYTITSTLSHVTADGENPTTITSEAEDLTLSYSAESGWNLPATISVTMGGTPLSSETDYDWDNGDLLIAPASGFTGNIVVTINGWQQLAAPTGLNVTNITSTSATLSWGEVANASSYTVSVYGENDEVIAEYPGLTEITKTVSDLDPETNYVFGVVAVGDGITYTNSIQAVSDVFTTSAAASPATITLSELGVTKTISTYSVGDQYTLPTTSSQSCDGKQLVGWSTVEVAETNTKPTSNYYELGAEVTLAATQTFYAVFAAGSGGESTEATLTFDNTSKRTTLTTEQQVWTENNITLTNDKASSTSDIIDSSNPTRFYKNSNITVSAPENITKIVATTSGGDYTTALVNSVGGGVTSDGNTVTITPSASNNTYTIQLTGGQVRLNSITVTYGGGGYTAYSTSCIPTYSITYDFEGGTGSHCSNTSVPQGGSYTICDEAPTKEGNTFLHWSDGVNTYNPSDVIANVTTDITLTAVWQPNTYTVTWNNNGVTTSKNYNHGETLEVPTAPASCDGVKEFVGWTTHSGYYHATTAPDDIFTTKTTPVTATATYYAVFATPGAGGTEFVLGESGTFKMYANVNGTNYYAQGGVSSNKLSSTTDILTASDYILTYADGSYTIKQGTSAIGHSSKTDLSTTASTWTISAGDNGSWRITSDKDNSRALSYSAEANAFKAYATSNLTAGNETYFDIEFGSGSDAHSDYTTICQTVESIEIANYTTEFFVTDEFAFGGTVTAHFDEGEPQDVTALAHFSGYNMNEVGTYTVTVTYMGATATYEITVKPLDNAWVLTWNVSGKTNTGLGPRSVTKGNAIGTLPTPAVPAACAGKTFMGWTTSNIVPSDGVGIVYITPETKPTDNTTYYAVFATVNNFCTQKPIDQITSGSNVVIVAVASLTDDGGAGKAISSRATDDTYNLQGDSVAIYDQTINTPHSTCIWTITESDGKYIFTQDGKYLNGIIDGNYSNLKYNNTSDSWSLSNAASGMAMTYNMKSTNASTEYVEWYNGKFTIHDEVNKNGDFDMQFFVTANKDGDADITDYTTGCEEYTITYYGFHGGYSTSCSSDGTIVLPVNSIHTIPDCEGLVINDHTNLGREFLNVWMTQPHGGHTFKPGDTFILTQDTTLYAQWKMETTSDVTTLPTDIEDLAGTDIYVYGGTTLNIQPGTTTINSLTLKGGLQADGSYKMPTVWVPEGATLVRNSNKINLDLIVNAKTWYPFAVPFATKNDQYIDYLDPVLNAASTYDDHFVIKTYDGARRATQGEDRANNWVKVLRHQSAEKPSYLQPGVGYIITALTRPDKDTATIRIPMTVPNTWFKNGEQAEVGTTVRNTIAVTAHAGDAATEHQRHAGWNFVANPYLTSFAGGNVANDGGLDYINGELIIEGSYEYTDEEVPYVTVPAYDFAYYSQHKLSDVKLSPEWSFFVQVGTDGTMNFTTAGRQQAPASIAARYAEERPVKMDVDLILSDNHNSDQTGIIICDRYSDAYEIGRDLEKLFGSAYNLSVYTLMEDNTPLAFQALAIRSSMQVIPVGYRAPEQGEYTFRLNEATSSIDLLNEQYEQLVLVDYQTGELTNLLYTDYTFYSERTQSNSRFAIYAVPRQNAPTDLPNAIGSDEEVRKVIYNDHLYILRDGNVYNGMGQKM